jgi:hypothetical protein
MKSLPTTIGEFDDIHAALVVAIRIMIGQPDENIRISLRS